mmetsp:Transcript_100641/g.215718  ORF Transcript_100641/g.215718 Transcript_100641/m.215718 type:complete len:80 (-) Transcript_100641:921-1160(-)
MRSNQTIRSDQPLRPICSKKSDLKLSRIAASGEAVEDGDGATVECPSLPCADFALLLEPVHLVIDWLVASSGMDVIQQG